MPRGKKKLEPTITPEAASVVEQVSPTEVNVVISSTGDISAIDICDESGQFVRQYSRLVHGDNYKELAESFLAGHPKHRKA